MISNVGRACPYDAIVSMPDLFLDNIEDPASFPDELIVAGIQALINLDRREDSLIDYKVDISEKDNWAETAAAFANTFGGMIVFGVATKGDQARNITGFDPKGSETRTRLTSTLLSRIHPRPEFAVRVLSLPADRSKEVALLQIGEGSRPPYMYSNGATHRILLRVGSQKTEADYLQLMALFERGRNLASTDSETLN